jgi:large subunit ribosomal protein L18
MRTQRIKAARKQRRTLSVRAKLKRTATLPRLSVHRSLKHISAQIIDDRTGRTLAAATSTAKALSPSLAGKTKTERAALIGAEIGRKAKEAGVQQVVFDRGGARFHGRLKALADGAREAGLTF